MTVTIISPEKEVYKGEVSSVKVPGTTGQLEVLKNHAPLVTSLGQGEVRLIESDGKKVSFQITGGFVEVLNNEIAVLVQGVEN